MPNRADASDLTSQDEVGDWPAAELETLGRCPICRGTRREVWLDGLQDWVFKSAPGRWTLWKCIQCTASYLDPRPDLHSIGRAYGTYYTHTNSPSKHFLVPGDRSDQPLKRALRASFYRWRFGHRLKPEIPLGWTLIASSARRRARAEQAVRHLPAAPPDGGLLLDVGCGDGSFLRVARVLGYSASGVETDNDAAAVATNAGFAVHVGSIDEAPLEANSVDQITLNHVIEHLHDPMTSLQKLYGSMRPGGRIWLQTPNIDGLGASRFKQAWRGLESPRHLVLFNPKSLQSVLEQAGFTTVQLLAPQQDALFYVEQSGAIAAGRDPYAKSERHDRRIAKRLAKLWNRIAMRDWAKAESITMIGFKPG